MRTNIVAELKDHTYNENNIYKIHKWVTDNVKAETLSNIIKCSLIASEEHSKHVLNLNVNRVIKEEASFFDVEIFGINFLADRADYHVDSIVYDLETAFFNEAVSSGKLFRLKRADGQKLIDKMIINYHNENPEISTKDMYLICSPSAYDLLWDFTDHYVETDFKIYNEIKTTHSVYLPQGVQAILLAKNSIFQPVVFEPYSKLTINEISRTYSTTLNYKYKTQCLNNKLIYYCN